MEWVLRLPEERGGGAGQASHRYPGDCPHHLGNELVVLSPVPRVWHCCPGTDPALVLPCLLLLLSQRGLQQDLPSPHEESLKATKRKTVSMQALPVA